MFELVSKKHKLHSRNNICSLMLLINFILPKFDRIAVIYGVAFCLRKLIVGSLVSICKQASCSPLSFKSHYFIALGEEILLQPTGHT
jgi:hypothetical protein